MNTNQIEKEVRYRFESNRTKQILNEKYQAKMLFAYRNGMWKAGPELLMILNAVPDSESLVILDLYGNPIRVDPVELKPLAFSRWQEQMNAWEVEYTELSTNR